MIEFFAENLEIDFEKLKQVEPVIRTILSDYEYKLNYVNVVLLSDEELLAINNEFLNHDYYTDIITFNYATEPKSIESELYISMDRVKENAESQRVDQYNELFRIIIHGTLHLVGYEDNTHELKEKMSFMENKYLKACFT